jgi:AAA ATPase domain
MVSGHFVGIGIRKYEDPKLPMLPRAVSDIEGLGALLRGAFTVTELADPTRDEVEDGLVALRQAGFEPDTLVVLWAGHAGVYGGALRLRTTDSRLPDVRDLPASELAVRAAGSGAGQVPLVIDACFAGAGLGPALDAAVSVLRADPRAGRVYAGVLVSCLAGEPAYDGLFGARLLALLRDGPTDPDRSARAWSPHNEYLTADEVGNTLLAEWGSGVQQPLFRRDGCSWWMFPNPRYRQDAPEQVVEHLLQAARSGARLDEPSWFTGRTVEVDRVVGWVRARRPGMYVVTGSAGTGKSAIVGRVVSLSNPAERERLHQDRLREDGRRWEHEDPGERSVQAHAHARAVTADRLADLLGEQLARAELVPRQEARRNANELLGQVQRAVEEGARPPVVVVDGLDEARGEAFTIAEDFLVRLAAHAVVVVSTRELRRGDERPSLVSTLLPGAGGSAARDADTTQNRRAALSTLLPGAGGPAALLDLDAADAQDRGRADLRAYVADRLSGVDRAMDAGLVAEHLAGGASMTGSRPFLLARVVTDQLRVAPVGTGVEGWQGAVSDSLEAAFEADLAGTQPPVHRVLPAGWTATRLARRLLTALTWGQGAGLPEPEWLAVANAELDGSAPVDADDLGWLLDRLGRYVVQDGESGVAVYRVAHQSLADQLRPPYAGSAQVPFDPAALPVASALLGRYRELLAAGLPAAAPGYLWRYAWRHASAAGPAGVDELRDLAAADPALRPDVALAGLSVAETYRRWGRRQEAVAPTEEAVATYRELAADNPAFLPNLAMALNNLGTSYAQVGRRQEAVAPTEEAVAGYRELAADNPAFLPNLATALNNLGTRYAEAGRSEQVDQVWQAVSGQLPAPAHAFLLLARAQAAKVGAADAAGWLAQALPLAGADRGLTAALHEEARRHRAVEPAGFDARWATVAGPPPPWLTVNAELHAAAAGWIATATYEAERDHLAAHPELLTAEADVAVTEALLQLPEDKAERYRQLREAACTHGAQAAYRPFLLTFLAAEFTQADPAAQRALLTEQREDLLDDIVNDTLTQLSHDDELAALRAAAVLSLARLNEHEAALQACEEPARFPQLLHDLATRPDTTPLQPATQLAATRATTESELATALFYLAVAHQLHAPGSQARATLTNARTLVPERVTTWINELATIGRTHPAVLALIPVLTAPPAPTTGTTRPG